MAGTVYCPGCGAGLQHGDSVCRECGADHVGADRMADLRGTAEKRHGAGEGWMRKIPFLLPLIAFRQESIEDAERALISYKAQFAEPGSADPTTVHCRGCGGSLDRSASQCDHCGAENTLAALEDVDYDVHDPTDVEQRGSDRWWLAIGAGPLLGLAAFFVGAALNLGVDFWGATFAGGLLAVGGLALDRRYLTGSAPWEPSFWWAVAFLWPPVNFVGPYVYLWKRVDVLGLREHLS